MTSKELAEKINGIEYRVEVDREIITKAKACGVKIKNIPGHMKQTYRTNRLILLRMIGSIVRALFFQWRMLPGGRTNEYY